MKRLLLGLMLLLVSGAASAEWADFFRNDAFTLYVDRATIRRNGNFVKMWNLTDYKKAYVIFGISTLSRRTQFEYDCTQEKMRRLAMTNFNGNMGSGTVNDTSSDTDPWTPVAPGSIGEILWKIACGKK